jgi:hypothetical protein
MAEGSLTVGDEVIAKVDTSRGESKKKSHGNASFTVRPQTSCRRNSSSAGQFGLSGISEI